MSTVMAMEGVNLSFKIGSGPRAVHKQVLSNLSFSVQRGEAFGFLGPSGAGKTTTIKLLTRQLKKDGGRIQLFHRPIENASDADYERIGILSDTSALYERLSIEDNLKFYAKVRGVSGKGIPALLDRMALKDDRKTLIKIVRRACGSEQRFWLPLFIHLSCCFWMSQLAGLIQPLAQRFIVCLAN